MDRIAVRGRGALHGEVAASGSKNSTLALMAGALLARGETHLSNVPRLRDVSAMLEILRALGARAQWHPDDDHAVRESRRREELTNGEEVRDASNRQRNDEGRLTHAAELA